MILLENTLKSRAISNVKIYHILCFFGLNYVGIYPRDGSFPSDFGVVNLHASKGTHWVCYINEKYFDSYGCVCPKKLSKFIIKRNGYCFFSENQIQKIDSFCASYCFYILFLVRVIEIVYKSVVLNLYYHRFS